MPTGVGSAVGVGGGVGVGVGWTGGVSSHVFNWLIALEETIKIFDLSPV